MDDNIRIHVALFSRHITKLKIPENIDYCIVDKVFEYANVKDLETLKNMNQILTKCKGGK